MIPVMIDLETTGTSANAGIVQIGAITFLSSARAGFTTRVSPTSLEQKGYEVDPATMAWWDKQDEVVRRNVFSGTNGTKDALEQFVAWANHLSSGNLDNIHLWANHIDFDLTILKNAFYRELGEYPFNFRNHYDYATLRNLFPQYKVEKKAGVRYHDAFEDAGYQADHAEYILAELQHNGLSNYVLNAVSS